jgi:hypothetical protein
VYVQAANLFTITDYTGQDPEVTSPGRDTQGIDEDTDDNPNDNNASFGIDYGTYPNNQKMYIIGVSLSF